jgi:methylenetetrahydrofolate--tRNA-(uracil-5-)-methyltransferase
MVRVVGGGFAGVECVWALANRGHAVELYEMRPVRMTPAHTTDKLSELVCSNSFKSQNPDSPAGQLKTEMKALGSLVIPTGERNSVPGGQALAVDRDKYADEITAQIEAHPLITVVREEVTPEMAQKWLADGDHVVFATGPLTSEPIGKWMAQLTGKEHLYFYDAVSPTVEASTINMDIVFALEPVRQGRGRRLSQLPLQQGGVRALHRGSLGRRERPV